jgi:glucosamine--fructose-6-phosphate aminotransferase (isomerizing)
VPRAGLALVDRAKLVIGQHRLCDARVLARGDACLLTLGPRAGRALVGVLRLLATGELADVGQCPGLVLAELLGVSRVLALRLAQVRKKITREQTASLLADLTRVPHCLEQLLARDALYEKIASVLFRRYNFLYLGRGIHFPIALEGALKLKEISYIHAEGYPAGEMKHGPNALIDGDLPVVALAAKDANNPKSLLRYEKMLSNIQEVRARDGIVIIVATEGDTCAPQLSDHIIYVPALSDYLIPILLVVPLQLLAYHIAILRGCDVDQPRNLAKSVTVE